MKKIFTLCSIGAMTLFANRSLAQINEHFENDSAALASDCWQFVAMKFAINPGSFASYVANGNGSLFSEPPVSAADIRIVRTPLLNVGSTIDVSFNYKLSAKLTGQSTRTISVDLVDNSGAVVQNLTTILLDNSNSSTSLISYSNTFTVNTPGIYRLAITISGTNGGLARLSIDELAQNAPIIGCSANSPLPVKLVSFQGNLNNAKVSLNWTVAENEINDHFEVEKSADGKVFGTTGIVVASAKSGAESYSFSETVNSERNYYRLKMFDKNQVINYSKILVFQSKAANNSSAMKIVNNPASDKLTLSFASANNQSVDIKVYDLGGRLQMNQRVNVYQGSNLISLQLNSSFKTGMYVVELSNDTERQTAKFVKQ